MDKDKPKEEKKGKIKTGGILRPNEVQEMETLAKVENNNKEKEETKDDTDKKKKRKKTKKKKKKDDGKKKKGKKDPDSESEDKEEEDDKNKLDPKEKQDIISDNYVMLMEMGKGAFGQIFLTYNMMDGEEVATKKEIKRIGKNSAPQLKMEFIVYKALLHITQPNQGPGDFQLDYSGKTKVMQDEIQGVPKFYGYGESTEFYYLIMQLLGPNLVELFNFCGNRKFTVATTCMLAIQMMNRIEYFHKHHYLHRDIKPENFLIGCGDKSNYVYLIDFGLCKKYKDVKTHQHIPYREGRLLTGTARYVSINTHLGIEQSRRDDLESIGYVLVFFLKGSLPWQGLKTNIDKYNKIIEKKLQIPTEILCYGLPDELAYYLNYCKSLRFEDRPDYEYLRGLYVKLLCTCISTYSITKELLRFDWCFEDTSAIWAIYNKKKGRGKRDSVLVTTQSGFNLDKKLFTSASDNKQKNATPNSQNMSHIEENANKSEDEVTPGGNLNNDVISNNTNNTNNNFAKTNENNPDLCITDINVSENSNFENSMKSDDTIKKEITPDITNMTKLTDKELLDIVNNNNANQEEIDVYVNKLILKNRNKHKKVKILDDTNNSNNNSNNNSQNVGSIQNKSTGKQQYRDGVEFIKSSRSNKGNDQSDNTVEIMPNNTNFKNISQFVNDYSDDSTNLMENKKLKFPAFDDNQRKSISEKNVFEENSIMPNKSAENLSEISFQKHQSVKSVTNKEKANAIIIDHTSSFNKKKTVLTEKDLIKLNSPKLSPSANANVEKNKPPVQKVFQESPIADCINKPNQNSLSNNNLKSYQNQRSQEHMITFKNQDNNQKAEDNKLKQIQPPSDLTVEAALRQNKSAKENKEESNQIIVENVKKENESNEAKTGNKLAVAPNSKFQRQKSFEENVLQKTNDLTKERRRSKIIDINTNPHMIKFSKDTMIKISNEPIQKYYTILGELGHGSYGAVKKVKHKQLGEERAMKIVKKKSESSQNEIEILKKISHPNIISIYEIFEDSKNYYIMSELCEGGELFEVITSQGTFSEVDAVKIMKQILNSVNYLHNKNIVHRDLKPENIMLINKNTINNSNFEIKIIDFGTAKQFERNQKLSKFIGTSYYIAPDVLAECYDEKCDVWSCGVILYILLCGYPPFNGASNIDIYHAIKYNPANFSSDEWKYVHKDAIDLIKQMLNKNPIKRFSAEMCLNHRWFKNYEEENYSHNKKENKAATNLNAINKMKDFVVQNKLKQAVLQYISTQFNLKEEEENLRELFKQFDTHKKGVINISDFTTILIKIFGENDGKLNAEMIFQNIDLDGSGEISYNEFITALIDGKNLVTNDRLEKAFKMFDKDNSGRISVEEIKNIFGGEENKWKKIVSEVDMNGDGEIDFPEFKIMMKGFEEKEIK